MWSIISSYIKNFMFNIEIQPTLITTGHVFVTCSYTIINNANYIYIYIYIYIYNKNFYFFLMLQICFDKKLLNTHKLYQ
jgi:hypothetical protein